jgi:hypothetical protein
MIDSGVTEVRERREVYVTSGPTQSEWLQPPASLHVVSEDNTLGLGQLISLGWQPSSDRGDDPELEDELQAWDQLSDSALVEFERALDEEI